MGSVAVDELLRRGGVTLSFTAPEAGRATLAWYGPRRVLLARARFSFANAASRRQKVELTRAAKTLRSVTGRLRLEAVATFTPAGRSTVTATHSFTASA